MMERKLWSTDGIAENERFSYWREELEALTGVRGERTGPESPAFEARLTVWLSEHLFRFRFDTDPYVVFRTSREIGRRSLHDWVWLYHETGEGAWFDQAGREVVTQPGDLIIAEAIVPFATRAQRGYHHDGWFLPRALIAPHLPFGRRPLWAHLSGQNAVDGLVQAYLGALTRQIESLADAEMGAVVDNFCRLIAIACGGAATEGRDAIRAAKLEQAKRYIDLHLSEPTLTPARVAAALKISVRQLHLLFEPTETSFARHVTARRLEECRAALASRLDSSRPIADIAFAWGFNNLGTFYRAFQRQFGVAPGDLRSAALRARAPVHLNRRRSSALNERS